MTDKERKHIVDRIAVHASYMDEEDREIAELTELIRDSFTQTPAVHTKTPEGIIAFANKIQERQKVREFHRGQWHALTNLLTTFPE